MAIVTAKFGFSSIVLDSKENDTSRENRFDGRSYALALSSIRLLKNIDVFDDMRQLPTYFGHQNSRWETSPRPSQFSLHFDNDIDGPMGQMVEDRFIRNALFAKIYESDQIDYKFASEVMEHKREKGCIKRKLRNGNKLHTRLVIGADGKNSELADEQALRRQVGNIIKLHLSVLSNMRLNITGWLGNIFYQMDPSLFCQ